MNRSTPPLIAVLDVQLDDTPAIAHHIVLGCAIRRLRRARGLTIEDLAFAAGLHPTYLSGIERGERNPTWTKLGGLADALGVSVSMIAQAAEQIAAVVLPAQFLEPPGQAGPQAS
ncbi:MAG TPA: helix-turn-helix transcriptional regulator [Solirubrobacteraceae bacterium]|nr:helix-turn-helix transcriptional regulator [Solirubrobacteraceae bacterium]